MGPSKIMKYGMTDAARLLMAAVAVTAWLGLGIQFYVTLTHPNLAHVSPFQRAVRFFEYFTILTNLLVALSLTISLFGRNTVIGQFFSRPSMRTAIAVYIALVGIVYNVILQGLNEFQGAAYVADFLTHDLVPILYMVFWLAVVVRGELHWMMPFAWTVYPLVYVPVVLIRGASTGRYPYPFLDVSEIGYAAVLVNTIILAVVFVGLGELFILADNQLARFRK